MASATTSKCCRVILGVFAAILIPPLSFFSGRRQPIPIRLLFGGIGDRKKSPPRRAGRAAGWTPTSILPKFWIILGAAFTPYRWGAAPVHPFNIHAAEAHLLSANPALGSRKAQLPTVRATRLIFLPHFYHLHLTTIRRAPRINRQPRLNLYV